MYYGLTDQGYKVFFSRITLEDKLGQQYEPYIFAALNSAKVMIVIGSRPENFNAVWVKNEWSRYLALMAKDRKRLLIPCYRDMDPYDLPEELGSLQSQDMSKIGFMQDMIRGIKKVLEADNKPEAISSQGKSGCGFDVKSRFPLWRNSIPGLMHVIQHIKARKKPLPMPETRRQSSCVFWMMAAFPSPITPPKTQSAHL